MTNEERITRILQDTSLEAQAFPLALNADTLGMIHGLTRREYFAAKAMQGMLAGGTASVSVKNVVKLADALCIELDKGYSDEVS